jgi:hypothetical protein
VSSVYPWSEVRGQARHVGLLDSLAGALRLEEAEHEHLRNLAARPAAGHAAAAPAAPSRSVRPGVKLLLESMRPNPAHVVGRTGDVLAHNPGGLRLFPGMGNWPAKQRNVARYIFLHPAARELFDDWNNQARGLVGFLRALAGTDPDAPDLAQLVGELRVKSPDFARLWERYDVKGHSNRRKTFHHPDVGDLTLGYQTMQLDDTPGHALIAYYAEPGTPEYDAMVLLDMAASESEHTSATGASRTEASN